MLYKPWRRKVDKRRLIREQPGELVEEEEDVGGDAGCSGSLGAKGRKDDDDMEDRGSAWSVVDELNLTTSSRIQQVEPGRSSG